MEAMPHGRSATKAISFHCSRCQSQTRILRPVSPCSVLVVSMSASALPPLYLFHPLYLSHQAQAESPISTDKPANGVEDDGVHDCYDALQTVNKRGFRDQWLCLGTRYSKRHTGREETEGRRAVMRMNDISWYRYSNMYIYM